MSRNNRHREPKSRGQRKPKFAEIIARNDRRLTPIEEIFLEIVGREMNPEERCLLLGPQVLDARHGFERGERKGPSPR